MQRESVSHQKVVIEIDFSGSIRGFTELTIIPVSQDLRSIHLHCRQCEIQRVSISSQTADFIHYDPLSHITCSKPDDVHLYPEIKRKLYSALSESDEGELSIAVPQDVITKQENYFANESLANSNTELGQLVVRIEYTVRNPTNGLQFVLPSEVYPYRAPHVYTTPSGADAARCWVPCVDNLWERCTWELEYVVPRYLDGRSDGDVPETGEEGEYPVVVVSSGELAEQVSHPFNSAKTIFVYNQPVPTSVQHIAFAAGPFHVLELPQDQRALDADEDTSSHQPEMHAFCLPGLEPLLSASTSFYRTAMTFFTSECGSYPFGSHKVVFVDELPTQRFDSSTLSIISCDLLHGEDGIEQVFQTRHSLAHALACQWVGINILQKTWADTWLINGLGLYITGLFIRRMFGNNEYRFRLKKDMDRIVQMDVGTYPPICRPTHLEPPDTSVLHFINLKSPVVIYILDRFLSKSGTSHGLSRILPKIFLSAISGELTGSTLGTSGFIRTCRKVSGMDPKTFADQWIYGSGCPRFYFSAVFNRKKLVVEFMMRQECPAYLANKNDPVAMALLKPVPFFEGTITVRIHEADGTPYEHVLDIRSPQKRYEVLFNTKYKRVRRNTKRYISRKAAAVAAAAGDTEAAEDMGLLDSAFEYLQWEDEKEREKWKVADWTEDDEQRMATATYEWIRMDADFEWIAALNFEQPDFMWVSQLQRDKDVVAQMEAIHALGRQPSNIVSSFLTRTVLVANYFYRIRMEAAMYLVNCAREELQFIGLFHLMKIFTSYCYEPQRQNEEFSTRFIPKPNDFSDIAGYYVRKSIITALGSFRDPEAKIDYVVPRFLIDQLKYNDNTHNAYGDGLYISTLIAALGATLVPDSAPEQSQLAPSDWAPKQDPKAAQLLYDAMIEVERYREMDQLVPSMHNVVSIAVLEWHLMVIMANLIPNDGNIFLKYTREGNYVGVRLAAFDGLLLMKWYTSKTLIRYIFTVITTDSSKVVRRHVARIVCESLGVLLAIGDIKNAAKETDILIEEDGSAPEKRKNKRSEVDNMIKSLKSGPGRSMTLRDTIMPVILDPQTDHQVRLCMIKFSDLLFRPTEESLPKMKILLPATPATDLPASLPSPIPTAGTPSIKLKPLAKRPFGSLLSPYPSTPTSATQSNFLPKLKLTTNRLTDTRSPLTANAPILPDTYAMPPPPVPEYALGQKPRTPSITIAPLVLEPPPAVKKREKQAPKSQSRGMSLTDLRGCRNALKKLLAYKHSVLFRQPVDPVRDHAPGYFERIKNPMDLSTINAKLDAGMYIDRFAFENDFNLMIRNAEIYNPPKTFAHNEALALKAFFAKQWEKITKTLEEAEAKAARIVPATTEVSGGIVQEDDMAQAALILEEPARNVDLEAVDMLTALADPLPPSPLPSAPPPTPASASATSSDVRPAFKLKLSSRPLTSLAASPSPSVPKPSVPRLQLVKEGVGSPSTPTPPKGSRKPSNLKRAVTPLLQQLATPVAKAPVVIDDVDDLLAGEIDAIEAETKNISPQKKEKDRPKERTKERREERPIIDPIEDLLDTSLSNDAPKEKGKSKDKSLHSRDLLVTQSRYQSPKPSAAGTPPIATTSVASPHFSQPPPDRDGSRGMGTPTPSLKFKLKSKEGTPVHSPSSSSSRSSVPIDANKCKALLRNLRKDRAAFLFLEPVDAEKLGCPTYYDEIKRPMDLSTMETKLKNGAYSTMEDFATDMRLIFANCRQFNPPVSIPVQEAEKLEVLFEKEWAKLTERKLSTSERLMVKNIISNIMQDMCSFHFREPVDPERLGIPHYFNIIDRKDARDLRTIKNDITLGKYDSFDAIQADINLMIRNARTFNGEHSDVAQQAAKVGRLYQTAFAKKRREEMNKAGGSGTPPPAKRIKLG